MSDQQAKKLHPKALSHFGIQTYDVGRIRDWYCAVLNAHVVFQKGDFFCTVSFDEEHHRIAIVGLPGKPRSKFKANAEIAHVAFEMDDLESLLLTWERLRDVGITPGFTAHHGATVSSYYFDPDGNQCELFTDCFPTKKECQDWFHGPYYQHNFGAGTTFDMEEALGKLRAGLTVEEIMQYPEEAGMKVDVAAFVKEYAESVASEEARFAKEMQAETADAQ